MKPEDSINQRPKSEIESEDNNEQKQNERIESVSKESHTAFWLAIMATVFAGASLMWQTIEGMNSLRDRRARDLVIDTLRLTSPDAFEISVINRLGKTVLVHRVDLEFSAEGKSQGTHTSEPFVSTDEIFVRFFVVNEPTPVKVNTLYELKDQESQVFRMKFVLSSALAGFKGNYCLTNITLVTSDGAYTIDRSKFPDNGKLVLSRE